MFYRLQEILTPLVEIKYVSTKADGDTDMFDIHAGVLQDDTLAPFVFIIVYLDYIFNFC